MHIILGLLAILGGGAFWWWQLKAMGKAASDINDAAGRLIGTYKRQKFLKNVCGSPLAAVDEREDVVAMLTHIAEKCGGLSQTQPTKISKLRKRLGFQVK